ncbi:MAG: class I SAM-dependent methyltransferase [Actinomycetota bacterium]
MGLDDAEHWDPRWRKVGSAPNGGDLPSAFASNIDAFPSSGDALEIACGRGRMSVWLARRGLMVHGVDVSPVAIDLASELAAASGVAGRCRFAVHDLDHGLPSGPPVDLVVCHLFRDQTLDEPMMQRLKPGGTLAVAVLSEVGAEPGRFRARPGELLDAFAALDIVAAEEAHGQAWLIGRAGERSALA